MESVQFTRFSLKSISFSLVPSVFLQILRDPGDPADHRDPGARGDHEDVTDYGDLADHGDPGQKPSQK